MSAWRLVLAAVFHQPRAETKLRSLRNDLAQAAADHGSGNRAGQRADLKALRLRGVGSAVAQQHVRELVRHYAGNFALGRRRFDHPAVDEHRPAGQRERVDVLEIHRGERVLERRVVQLARRGLNQPIAKALEIAAEFAIR